MSPKDYWLNDVPANCERHSSGLLIQSKWQDDVSSKKREHTDVYFSKLKRERWEKFESKKFSGNNYLVKFYKKANNDWRIWKLFYAGINHPTGKGPYYETHILQNVRSGKEIVIPDAERADIYKNQFLWAEKGKIMGGILSKKDLEKQTILFDTNALTFEELVAHIN